MDWFIALYFAGILVTIAAVTGLAILARREGLGLLSIAFIALLFPWYLGHPWSWILLCNPSWWDQYSHNSLQWYPLFVALSVGPAIVGKRLNASRGFLRTVTMIPLLSSLPWGCVVFLVMIVSLWIDYAGQLLA